MGTPHLDGPCSKWKNHCRPNCLNLDYKALSEEDRIPDYKKVRHSFSESCCVVRMPKISSIRSPDVLNASVTLVSLSIVSNVSGLRGLDSEKNLYQLSWHNWAKRVTHFLDEPTVFASLLKSKFCVSNDNNFSLLSLWSPSGFSFGANFMFFVHPNSIHIWMQYFSPANSMHLHGHFKPACRILVKHREWTRKIDLF